MYDPPRRPGHRGIGLRLLFLSLALLVSPRLTTVATASDGVELSGVAAKSPVSRSSWKANPMR